MSAKRMLVLAGGTLSMPLSRIRRGGSPDEIVQIPMPYFLIDTDDGWVLFETGCDPRVTSDPAGTWGRLAEVFSPEISEDDQLVNRLASVGVQPSDIAHVVVSHLHMDHAGGVKLFPGIPIHVQKSEYRWALHPDRIGGGGYLRHEIDDGDLDLRLVEGDDEIVPGVHVILTEGHTPGHQSLIVDLPSGRHVITGDCAYEESQIEKRVPPPVTVDDLAAVRSLARIRALARRDQATVIVNHDADAWARVRLAPQHHYR